MQRAGRIIYNGAMVVSLLLCLGCAGVWVRSGWVCENVDWNDWPADRSYLDVKYVRSSQGGLQFIFWHVVGIDSGVSSDEHFIYSKAPADRYPLFWDNIYYPLSSGKKRYAALGFELVLHGKGRVQFGPKAPFTLSSLTLPLYFPTLLFALLPAHYFLRVRRRRRSARRLARGCCPACGYDLRASAGRCPECGLEPASAHS